MNNLLLGDLVLKNLLIKESALDRFDLPIKLEYGRLGIIKIILHIICYIKYNFILIVTHNMYIYICIHIYAYACIHAHACIHTQKEREREKIILTT
jgi:hypothetical protein